MNDRTIMFCASSRAGRASVVVILAVASLIVIGVLAAFALSLRPEARRASSANQTIRVYCAAGVVAPVEQLIGQFNDSFGARVEITRLGGSGELAGQMAAEHASGVTDGADICILADDSLMAGARENGIVAEVFPLAIQKPVIAVAADRSFNINSLSELATRKDVSFGITSSQAAVGKLTRQIAERDGVLPELLANRKTDSENVMTLAQALATGSLDAAVLWDTTVNQINQQADEVVLRIAAIADPQDEIRSNVVLGIIDRSQHSTLGLKFARYLTAPETGAKAFESYGYETVPGDRWEEVPEIHLYCGSMFTPVLEKRVRQFASREGVNIYARWEGCGKLVAAMQTINDPELFPDAYLACDVSFLDQVRNEFETPVTLTSNEVVMAVRKDLVPTVKDTEDLLNPEIRVGICDPEQSALGALTKDIFSEVPYSGFYDRLAETAAVHVDVGPTLISQLMAGGLDVAVVYRSNIMADPANAEKIRIVDIMNASGVTVAATQPWAISKSTANPYLLQRLFDTIVSDEIREQFVVSGFDVQFDSRDD